MPLMSDHFKGDARLNRCLVEDAAHVTPGQSGDFVSLIQSALQILDDAEIAGGELAAKTYGPITAGAVLSYKRKRDIVNRAYQTTADDIVGRMTIAALDQEMLARQVRPAPAATEYFVDVGHATPILSFAIAAPAASKKPAPKPGPNPFPWPVTNITLKVGETKILGLRKFNVGPPPDVVVQTSNTEVAFVFQCGHLKDRTKERYTDKTVSDMINETAPVELHGFFFFQITGKKQGAARLDATQRGGGAYAASVMVIVEPNPKALSLGAAFATLWNNHPLQTANGKIHYPCVGNDRNKDFAGHNPPLFNMQCMVRLCWALDKSGVDLSGMRGFTSCFTADPHLRKKREHRHHFSDPNDFSHWSKAIGKSYDFNARPPFAPEPMPGLAAFWFVQGRTGIIRFDHYFTPKGREAMTGGHIDLWNRNTMGNTIQSPNAYEGMSAFLRSKRIRFWPID